MTDVRERLRRQAEWQKRRKTLKWAEKVRLAEAIREDIVRLRRSWPIRKTRGSE